MTGTTRRQAVQWTMWAGAAMIALTPAGAIAKDRKESHVLVFSHTTGYRHASIETGVAALKVLGARAGFRVTASEDPAIFTPEGLKQFDAIILLNNTTKPNDPASEYWTGDRAAAFQRFVEKGGGVVGIHGATDSHYGWRWYGQMMGGYFQSHPKGTPTGAVTVHNHDHGAVKGLPRSATRTDEWYYFKDLNPTTTLLATVDPQSIGEADHNANPVAWAHTMGKARIFYTAMGHTDESYAEPWFLAHLEKGINWVLRRKGK